MIKADDIESITFPKPKQLPAAIRAELDRLGVTQAEAAFLLRVNDRTMRRYLQEPGTEGYTQIPFSAFALLRSTKA